jgi:hypothetical protein
VARLWAKGRRRRTRSNTGDQRRDHAGSQASTTVPRPALAEKLADAPRDVKHWMLNIGEPANVPGIAHARALTGHSLLPIRASITWGAENGLPCERLPHCDRNDTVFAESHSLGGFELLHVGHTEHAGVPGRVPDQDLLLY